MNFTHKFDYTGENYKRGMEAENLFVMYCKKNGLKYVKAGKTQDTKGRIDFFVEEPITGVKYSVQVKGMKKFNKVVQDTKTIIELHGVEENHLGWLYGGKADFIFFQTLDGFIKVDRLRLAKFIDGLIDKPTYVSKLEEADANKNKVYRRRANTNPDVKNSYDEICYIRKTQLIDIGEVIYI